MVAPLAKALEHFEDEDPPSSDFRLRLAAARQVGAASEKEPSHPMGLLANGINGVDLSMAIEVQRALVGCLEASLPTARVRSAALLLLDGFKGAGTPLGRLPVSWLEGLHPGRRSR